MPKLRDLGERETIEFLKGILDREKLPVRIGDDCAAISFGDDYLLVTTDVINQRTHIPKGATSYQIGWHIVAINLSDIAAMGGKPIGIVVAMSLPRTFDMASLKEIAKGMDECAREFDLAIIGGDTKESQEISLCWTAFGLVPKNRILLRSGARIGDVVGVTGELGKAGWSEFMIKKGKGGGKAIENLLKIHPRINEGLLLSKTGWATSCIDISDGLASSLYQLTAASSVFFEIDFDRLPIFDEAGKLPDKVKDLALYHGGDYELLATVNPKGLDLVQREFKKAGKKFTPIGAVVEDKGNTLITRKGIEKLENKGYEHFR